MENKNEELINSMMKECHERIIAARKQLDDRKFGAAKSTLYAVTTLMDSLQTLDKGSKWADD